MTTDRIAHIAWLAAAALALAACQQFPIGTSGQAAAPQVSEDTLRDRANEQLAAGIKQYDAGEYDAAVNSPASYFTTPSESICSAFASGMSGFLTAASRSLMSCVRTSR